jgi:hypothetical protein
MLNFNPCDFVTAVYGPPRVDASLKLAFLLFFVVKVVSP